MERNHMGLSWNGRTIQWMVYKGKSYQNASFGGTPILGNLHIAQLLMMLLVGWSASKTQEPTTNWSSVSCWFHQLSMWFCSNEHELTWLSETGQIPNTSKYWLIENYINRFHEYSSYFECQIIPVTKCNGFWKNSELLWSLWMWLVSSLKGSLRIQKKWHQSVS